METAGPASGEASCEESREEKNRTEPFFPLTNGSGG
jgi:hypothetical protein